jgi:hypothetical protein
MTDRRANSRKDATAAMWVLLWGRRRCQTGDTYQEFNDYSRVMAILVADAQQRYLFLLNRAVISVK